MKKGPICREASDQRPHQIPMAEQAIGEPLGTYRPIVMGLQKGEGPYTAQRPRGRQRHMDVTCSTCMCMPMPHACTRRKIGPRFSVRDVPEGRSY